MSVDKIGKIDQNIAVNYSSVHQRRQKEEIAQNDTVVHDTGGRADLTKIHYPPFFPLGDTQSIYKK